MMAIISALQQNAWQAIAFALVVSFTIETICHCAKEKREAKNGI